MALKAMILTEKSSQCEDISKAMNWSKAGDHWKGTLNGMEVSMVCARGHLLTLKSPDDVLPKGVGWNNPKALLPIPDNFDLIPVPKNPKAQGKQAADYLATISKHIRNKDVLILATDSDRAGEHIAWSIKEHFDFKGTVKRAWFSGGLDEKSVIATLNNLKEPHVTRGWARAEEARSRTDWAYQLLVRAYTHYASYQCFGEHVGDGKTSVERVVSVGRVQSPSLQMIANRDKEISQFRANKHYTIKAEFSVNGNAIAASYSPHIDQSVIERVNKAVLWVEPTSASDDALEKPLYISRNAAMQFGNNLKAATAVVKSFKSGTRSEAPPKTFKLDVLQGKLCEKLGVNGEVAQAIVEDLYEQKFTSYPRTDHAELPIALYGERNSVLSQLAKVPSLSSAAQSAMAIHDGKNSDVPAFIPKHFVNKPMEHYGIIPTSKSLSAAALDNITPKKAIGRTVKHTSSDMKEAFLIIAKQYIQAMHPPATYKTQQLVIESPVQDLLLHPTTIFQAKSEQITKMGWRDAFGASKQDRAAIKDIQVGTPLKTDNIAIAAQTTKPPVAYTDITFTTALGKIDKFVKDPARRARLKETKGIGTPATRKTILPTLLSRGYIKKKGEYIHATQKGIALLTIVPNWIKEPETTAMWEDFLVKICAEKDDAKCCTMRDEFVQKQRYRIEQLILSLTEKYEGKLGVKRARVGMSKSPTNGKTTVPKVITENQKAWAIKLRDQLPAGSALFTQDVLTSPKAFATFIDKAKLTIAREKASKANSAANASPPTPKMIELANKLRLRLPDGDTSFNDNTTKRMGDCRAFLQHATEVMKPTSGQEKFAAKIWNGLDPAERPESKTLTTSKGCQFIIDKFAPKKGNSNVQNFKQG